MTNDGDDGDENEVRLDVETESLLDGQTIQASDDEEEKEGLYQATEFDEE
ncbi:hypothetical protein [Haloarcula sp. CBA1127]|nr:hypothetical protein [Haloarcula sp. CBA1127]